MITRSRYKSSCLTILIHLLCPKPAQITWMKVQSWRKSWQYYILTVLLFILPWYINVYHFFLPTERTQFQLVHSQFAICKFFMTILKVTKFVYGRMFNFYICTYIYMRLYMHIYNQYAHIYIYICDLLIFFIDQIEPSIYYITNSKYLLARNALSYFVGDS